MVVRKQPGRKRKSDSMNIGIIGAGRVGVTVGKYLSDAGLSVMGYYSKTQESADEAATFTNTFSYRTLDSLVKASDTLFITVPDDTIKQVWDCIADMELSGYTVCHFSGLLSSSVFSGIEQTGAAGCSVYPMYAFSDRFTSYLSFSKVCLTMEGEPKTFQKMKKLFEGLGHKVLTIKSRDKVKYHAAAVMASNEMLGLMQASMDLLSDCDLSEQDSMLLLRPLVEGNIRAMLDKGCVEAMTGPVERGDAETVKKHLEALQGTEEGAIYQALGSKMLSLARRKNPDRDYTVIQDLMMATGQPGL